MFRFPFCSMRQFNVWIRLNFRIGVFRGKKIRNVHELIQVLKSINFNVLVSHRMSMHSVYLYGNVLVMEKFHFMEWQMIKYENSLWKSQFLLLFSNKDYQANWWTTVKASVCHIWTLSNHVTLLETWSITTANIFSTRKTIRWSILQILSLFHLHRNVSPRLDWIQTSSMEK